jgi:acyl carrier protein
MFVTPPAGIDPSHAILRAARSVLGQHPDLNPGHTFDELRCDSLDRVALAATIELSTGLSVPDHVLANARTLGDLIDHFDQSCGESS